MTEYHTCPQCGSTQPALQNFCGECGSALREGVTRPLTAGERATLEDPARWNARPAEDSPAQAWPDHEPAHRPPLVTALLLGTVLLLLVGAGFSLWALIAGQRGEPPEPVLTPTTSARVEPVVIPTYPPGGAAAPETTPPVFLLLERDVVGHLGQSETLSGLPAVLITFTMKIGPRMSTCPNDVSTFWYFTLENRGPSAANILVDQSSIRLVDSTGHVYSGQSQCLLDLRGVVAEPSSIGPGSTGYASVTLDVNGVSTAATYLDLHMQISGQHVISRVSLP